MKDYEFFLNYSCNAQCGFCFNPIRPAPQEEKGLPFARVAQRMYEAYGQGFRGLKFIGGEVTLREDLPKIVRLARKIGYARIQVTTNGIRLAERYYAAKLTLAGVDSFRFSIHGHNPEIHDSIVGVPGAFAKVMQAQENLRTHGLEIGINTVVNRVNYRSLADITDFFFNRMNVKDVLLYYVRHQGFMELPENQRKLEVPMSEAARFMRLAYDRLQAQGHARLPCFFHVPPCLLQEYAAWALDWSIAESSSRNGGAENSLVIHPNDKVDSIESVTNRGKKQIAACARCLYQERCLGVERNYVARYGEGEFRPVPLAQGAPA